MLFSAPPNRSTRTPACLLLRPLACSPAWSQVSGAILADEMGLGKTVELLACITANPYTGPPPVFDDGPKRCCPWHASMRGGDAVQGRRHELRCAT